MSRDAPRVVRTNIRSALIVDIPSQERLPQALSKAIILPHLLDEPISIVGGKKGLRQEWVQQDMPDHITADAQSFHHRLIDRHGGCSLFAAFELLNQPGITFQQRCAIPESPGDRILSRAEARSNENYRVLCKSKRDEVCRYD